VIPPPITATRFIILSRGVQGFLSPQHGRKHPFRHWT
jgi:hypothetical protein